ncbi:MAG: transposase [Candidatus Aminicenantes bacterium]|nr:transposase [Candidatus Aminicenantes bacterium]
MEENVLERAKERVMEKVIKEYFKEDLSSERGQALKRFFEEMLNERMRVERAIFLEKDESNKGNGYYQRDLVTGFLKLNLDVPRDRNGKFRPQVLPAHYLYTTNSVGNFNSRIEQIRVKLGGYLQSVEILEINLLLQTERLKKGKWKNPLPVIKSRAYEIYQLFNLKFYAQTQNY